MPGIQDVVIAAKKAVQAMREAYIDLRGMPAVWKSIPVGAPRRDFYGDILPDAQITYAESNIKVVISQRDMRMLIDRLNTNNTVSIETDIQHSDNYSGLVKHSVNVIKGDLIVITDPRPDSFHLTEGVKFRVTDVMEHVDYIPLSKTVLMSPFF